MAAGSRRPPTAEPARCFSLFCPSRRSPGPKRRLSSAHSVFSQLHVVRKRLRPAPRGRSRPLNTLTRGGDWGVGGGVSVNPFSNAASEHHRERRHHHDADGNRRDLDRIEAPAPRDGRGKSGSARLRMHHRTVAKLPLMTVGWPALTSGAVPRSKLSSPANLPTTASKTAHSKPTATILRWVPRSAPYMEWFMATSRISVDADAS